MSLFVRPLSPAELRRLTKLAGSRTAPAGLVQRARLIIRSSRQEKVPNIATSEGVSETTVRKWLHRFNRMGMGGLSDRPGRGRPPKYTAEERSKITSLAKTPPPQLGERFPNWTLARLEERIHREGITIKRSQIRRILKQEQVRWQSPSGAPGRSSRAVR